MDWEVAVTKHKIGAPLEAQRPVNKSSEMFGWSADRQHAFSYASGLQSMNMWSILHLMPYRLF